MMWFVICLSFCFVAQVNVGIGLLTTVRSDLQNVIGVCEQVKKPTNYLRNVISDLMKGTTKISLLFTTLQTEYIFVNEISP